MGNPEPENSHRYIRWKSTTLFSSDGFSILHERMFSCADWRSESTVAPSFGKSDSSPAIDREGLIDGKNFALDLQLQTMNAAERLVIATPGKKATYP